MVEGTKVYADLAYIYLSDSKKQYALVEGDPLPRSICGEKGWNVWGCRGLLGEKLVEGRAFGPSTDPLLGLGPSTKREGDCWVWVGRWEG